MILNILLYKYGILDLLKYWSIEDKNVRGINESFVIGKTDTCFFRRSKYKIIGKHILNISPQKVWYVLSYLTKENHGN